MRSLPAHASAIFCAAAFFTGAGAELSPLTPEEVAFSDEVVRLDAERRALFAGFTKEDGNPESASPQADRERRVRELAERYERLQEKHPDAVDLLVLHAKFLREIGDRERAKKYFLRADRLDPALAVVKHQLGAIRAEEGDFTGALPLLREAVRIAPEIARHRYDFAEFLTLAKPLFAPGGPLTRTKRDAAMMENFSAAAKLAPTEAGYRWRAAEAWYDVEEPDAAAALAAWTDIAARSKTPAEKETVGLHRARWLATLGKFEEARALIAASTLPKLKAAREKLLATPGVGNPK